MSQFNYSRNITFDVFSFSIYSIQFSVAIQLFAEYNFWYAIKNAKTTTIGVAIQLFAEYNFWYNCSINNDRFSRSQFNYSRNITFDLLIQVKTTVSVVSQFNYSRNITFDDETKPPTAVNVAIQLFAEYNFWSDYFQHHYSLILSQFNYSRNITFDKIMDAVAGEMDGRNSIIRGI